MAWRRVADYFAQLNNKMGGDLQKIQIVGEYMVEIWKAVGMDMSRVQVLQCRSVRVAECCEKLRKSDGPFTILTVSEPLHSSILRSEISAT